MPDNNNSTDQDIDQLPEKDLRRLLRESQKSNAELARTVAQSNAALAVHDAGLSHLNPTQRGALVFALGDKEVNADNLKAAAAALSFPTEPASTTSSTSTTSTPPTEGNGTQTPSSDNTDSQPNQHEFLPEMPNSIHPDPRLAREHSITGLTKAEHAGVMALRGGTEGGAFDKAVKDATSKKDLLAAISNHGAEAGIVLDSDLV